MYAMKISDARALIAEIRNLKCKKGRAFMERIEALAPETLQKEDALYLQWLYRYASGGLSCHISYHDRA